MTINVEPIQPQDYATARQLVATAFADMPYSDGDEADLIGRLRESDQYNPAFELVAKQANGTIVGYGLLSTVIVRFSGQVTPIQALAPLAVAPGYQGQGIGRAILSELESRATLANVPAISVVGDLNYYGQLGYVMAENFNIHSSLPIPMANHLIKPLRDGSLAHIAGVVEYPAAFEL